MIKRKKNLSNFSPEIESPGFGRACTATISEVGYDYHLLKLSLTEKSNTQRWKLKLRCI